MDESFYLTEFKRIAGLLNQSTLQKHGLELAVGFHLDSVFLKLYKKSWSSPAQDPLTAESRIFFSIWLNDEALTRSILFYNIHALKLRKLKGYRIESRKFAENFRLAFKTYEKEWPNVSVNFGPLTLMQGIVNMNETNLEQEMLQLCASFLPIAHLIDETLVRSKI